MPVSFKTEERGNIAKGEGKRYALMVSNGEYLDPAFPNLQSTTKDNADLSKLLKDPGIGNFEVTNLVDESLLNIRKGVAKISMKAKENDLVLFYYSGSCFRDQNNSLYLPAKDSEANYLNATSVEADFILSQFRSSACKQFVILIDGCHSGAFFNNNRGIPNGLIALTACKETELCYETKEGGVFTQCIINGIKKGLVDENNDGKISVSEIYRYVKVEIAKTHYKSTPQKWEWNLQEPIYLVHQPKSVFISYAREEQDIVKKLSEALETSDILTFIDTKGIGSGEDWRKKLASEIESARAFLFVISKSSLDSKWAERELNFADSKGIPIFPVTLDQDEVPSWFEFQFGHIQRHFIDKDDVEGSANSLIEAIRNYQKELPEKPVKDSIVTR